MSDISTLPVQGRERAGKGAARAVRREGLVPGVIYGDKKEPVLIKMDPRPLWAELHKGGFYARQYSLDLNGETYRVMAQDVHFHAVSDAIMHIDFLRISATSRVTAEVPVRFLNEELCPGIKKGGVLNIVRHDVELVGTPDAMPDHLDVDLSGFDVGESIHFSAVTLPEGVHPTIADRDFTIATVTAPSGMRSEAAEDEGEAEEA
ncbi:50S ribosomal protein L25/general stress protein Ctc [Roseospira marina]|uniref:Large ribosomal subunit protein bL25 n=1 Tax=Roseospira marina TaxID=140057 RepID=A0A5M6I806_9PROT|nr:50S ribosomal protein L25/general stress protein Ctc [Roseospira marina]KAA5604321.1 50S ribosomal protein L25/general stress protein Ctc [Roseospira marina]MBB4315655.1 large subunit ribosomal protein L25 [Roseospira marina]MBB5088713.1 large subunit ribosomal protein L25 [Roseospira marina]